MKVELSQYPEPLKNPTENSFSVYSIIQLSINYEISLNRENSLLSFHQSVEYDVLIPLSILCCITYSDVFLLELQSAEKNYILKYYSKDDEWYNC